MPCGGARPGAGRKLSSKNRLLNYALAKVAEGLTPLDYMLEVMRDTSNPMALRLDAAKAAAPYCHPRLAQIEHKPAEGAEGQIVFLGGVLASPAPMIEMQKMDERAN